MSRLPPHQLLPTIRNLANNYYMIILMQVVQGYHGEGEYGVVVEDDRSPALPFKVSATVCITLHTACL